MKTRSLPYPTSRWLQVCMLIIVLFVQGCRTSPTFVTGEGYVEVSAGKIWYYVAGETQGIPLLMLHGGPGGTSYSLFALSDLGNERPLILFDQPGTGRSDYISDTSLMNMPYFVEQLHEITTALRLKEFYLYGHSWGTMLAVDYYLAYPDGIRALLLNSPLISTDLWIRDADTLIATLPDSIQQAIRVHEASKTYDSPAYREATHEYYQHFIRRYPRVPNHYITPVEGNSLMYNYMWGPSEFTATGTLRNYNRLDRLPEITVPTLFITGEYDEARPVTVKYYTSLVPNAQFELIENAAHATMHDNREANVAVISNFLKELERH